MMSSRFVIELKIAWLNLVEHRRRSLLLGSAIGSITCLALLLASLSAGLDHTLRETAATFNTGHLNVNGAFKPSPNVSLPVLADYERAMRVIKETVPELDHVVQRGRGAGRIVAEGHSQDGALNGVDINADPALVQRLVITSGKLRDLEQKNTVLVFEEDAKNLAISVGDMLTISSETTRGVANTTDCRVVAIARDVGLLSAGNFFISLDTLRSLYQVRPDATGVLQLHLEHETNADLPAIARRLREALARANFSVMPSEPGMFLAKLEETSRQPWTGQKVDVTTWQDEVAFMMWSYRALRGLSGLLLAILLAVTLAGIMNSFWIATRERTREIGALRAIGMQRAQVARLFLLEAGLLGALSALGGVLPGLALASVLNHANLHVPLSVQVFIMRDTLELAIQPGQVLLLLATMTAAACLAALLPAIRAARKRPVEAMAHFG